MEAHTLPARACDVDHGPMIIALSWSLLLSDFVVISLRIYTRCSSHNGISSDDYTIIASLLAGTVGVAFCTIFARNGLGRHIFCLPQGQIPFALKYSIMGQIFNILGIGLAKISVCLCLLRILDRARTHLSKVLWALIVFVSASHLSQVLLFVVQCRPMPAIWSPQDYPSAKCFSAHITYLAGYVGFGLDAFTDLICTVIPVFILGRLQINTRTKVALCCLMALGSLTAGCAIAKAILLKGVFSRDFTFAEWKPAVCTIVEHLAGLILISLSALKPLFSKMLNNASSWRTKPSWRTSRRSSERYFYNMRRRSKGQDVGAGSANEDGRKVRRNDDTASWGSEEMGIVKTTDFRLASEQVSRMEEEEEGEGVEQ